MINIQDLADYQLNHLAAKAQGWYLDADRWIERNEDRFVCEMFEYTPTTNGQQAMDLQKGFKLYVRPEDSMDTNSDIWVSYVRDTRIRIEAPTPERAIALAVVASKFGMEIDEGELG